MKKMRKHIIILIIMIILTGCGTEGDVDTMSKEDLINKVKNITITDINAGQYEDELNIMLSEDELNTLKESVRAAEITKDASGSLSYYKLILIDENESESEEWIVNIERKLVLPAGILKDDGKISECLAAIEKNHGITYESVLNRKPGPQYMKALKQANSAELFEITENNFTEGINYILDKEDIKTIQECADLKYSFDNTRNENIDIKASIRIYDENDVRIYAIDIDENGLLYCNGWEIKEKIFVETFNKIIKKSGL